MARRHALVSTGWLWWSRWSLWLPGEYGELVMAGGPRLEGAPVLRNIEYSLFIHNP